ncbi:hypothetical protein FBY35_6900 [Streptomyces sp. SLBN-118]|nr:hypothetical protein FBY35_6900 [Streptomyces sp. SLBN-118]
MSYRGCEIPYRGMTGGHGAGHIVAVLRAQRRQTGHRHGGTLWRLSQRTVLDSVLMSVAVVMALRLRVGQMSRRGTRNVFTLDGGLKMSTRYRDALIGDEVTHRGVRVDGVRVQQAEEE